MLRKLKNPSAELSTDTREIIVRIVARGVADCFFPFAQNIYQKLGISSHFDSKDGLILRQLLHYLIRHPSSWRSALFEVSNLITF